MLRGTACRTMLLCASRCLGCALGSILAAEVSHMAWMFPLAESLCTPAICQKACQMLLPGIGPDADVKGFTGSNVRRGRLWRVK